jgi:hypothetical protein
MTIVYMLIAIFMVAIIAYAVYDLIKRYRRGLVTGAHLFLWLAVIFFFPVVGSLIYAFVRPAPPLEDAA